MPKRRELLGAALAAGLAPAWLRQPRAAEAAPLFALGVASGQPRADGVVLWTRLVGEALPPAVEVRWELAHDEAFARIAARGSEDARAADAHSVHAEPAGLAPDRWYFYRFHARGQTSAVGRTRTAPAPDAAVGKLVFATASCQRWDHGHYAAWRDAAGAGLDLVVFVGDYIYEYASAPGALRAHAGGVARTLDDYRARYAQYKSDPALQAAHAACPWLVVWDDHEVENDYAGLQSATLDADFAARRAAAYQAYWEHQPFPKAARPAGGAMRIYGRVDWGRLARVHLVDDRQYRDPQACPRPGRGGSNTVALGDCAALADPRRTLFGSAQERWLAEGWSLERPWNLLAQQTLMARFRWQDKGGAEMAWTDGWDGYPAARARLLGTLAERRVPGVVVFGGDVHANYVADLKADFDDPRSPTIATEFCGTSISSQGIAQDRIDAALGANPHIRLARSELRGYQRFVLGRDRLEATLRTVVDARDPASEVRTLARFDVAADRPGAQPA